MAENQCLRKHCAWRLIDANPKRRINLETRPDPRYRRASMNEFRFAPLRAGLTRKFECGLDVYLTVNPKPDGEPGEIFVKLGKQGSTVSGLMQAWAITISAALQRGVPWPELRAKYAGTAFDPNSHEYTSLVDAVAKNVDALLVELRIRADKDSGQKQLDFEQTD